MAHRRGKRHIEKLRAQQETPAFQGSRHFFFGRPRPPEPKKRGSGIAPLP
jgi:hypothetical protein